MDCVEDIITINSPVEEEMNKTINNFTEQLAVILLEPNNPLLKLNFNFKSPVKHQADIASDDSGFMKVGGRRESDLFALIIAFLKEICNCVLPESGENLFSRIKAKLGSPFHDTLLGNVISLYNDKKLGKVQF